MVDVGDRVKSVALQCKRVIYSQFYYLQDRKFEASKLDYSVIPHAIEQQNEELLDEITEQELVKAYNQIELILENLTHDRLHGLIKGSQILAMLSMLIAVTIKSHDVADVRKCLEKETLQTKDGNEMYHCLTLGVLETIYSLSKKDAAEQKPVVIIN